MIPRDIRVVDELPVLGTGKVDYVTLSALAAQPTADVRDQDEDDEAA